MILIGYIVIFIYSAASLYILIYCMMQLHLLIQYQRKNRKNKSHIHATLKEKDLPFVTIQLPIYNEYYVIERLIDNICNFDYPKDKFEIQILDDSTDETIEKSEAKVSEYRAKGFNIERITRKDREGFKAGALKYGMQYANGDFIAIFDADFLPNPTFLKETLPYFKNPKIGVVQTRWEHINRDYSLLTKLQAFQLNVHFTVEQSGREYSNYFLQFNGTAGIWRKETIEDAGGWEADTLTEDLDLSYRAQLKGWKIQYLEEIGSPAELPSEMNGLKSQQFRWMKGGAETARKMLPEVWRSKISWIKKFHASVHLLNSSVFLCVFIIGFLSVPMIFLLGTLGLNTRFFALFFLSLVAIFFVYYVANANTTWKNESIMKTIFKFLILFPVFLSLSMGLSLHNSFAVIQGYLGKKSAFIRTPKFNIHTIKDRLSRRKYLSRKVPLTTIFEGVFSLYFIAAIFYSISIQELSFVILYTLLALGYGTICLLSLKHLSLK